MAGGWGVEPTVQAPTSLHREYQPRPQGILIRSVVRGRAANHNDNDCDEIDNGGDGEMGVAGGRLNSLRERLAFLSWLTASRPVHIRYCIAGHGRALGSPGSNTFPAATC